MSPDPHFPDGEPYPTGPSDQDLAFANAYPPPSGAPGLLRDRIADETVASGHLDYSYGPERRETVSCD
jgi:hypothetical protein